VVTAKQSELQTLPRDTPENSEAEDVIPKRNRGRVRKKNFYETDEDEEDNTVDEKERFREWKKKQKVHGSETGLFKKWKKEVQRRGKKEPSLRKGKETANEIDDYEEHPKKVKYFKILKENELEGEEKDNEEEEEEDKEPLKDGVQEERDDDDDGLDADNNDNTIDTDDLIDYPGGMTEYAPPEEFSCSEFVITDELRERQQSVREACDRLEPEMGSQRLLYSRLRWAVPQRLLYCPVFKAASTSWLVNYLKLSNSTTNPKEGNLHTKITNLFPAPATFKLRKRIFSESIKFIIVRHPFERLVSAYRDKLAGFSRNKHYLDMRKHIITNYRLDKKNKSAIPTFRESVDFVLNELKKMEAGSSNLVIDGHFMPYTRRCIPCAIDYDVIIKFETLEDDSQYLIEQCQLEDKLQVTHENAAPTGPRTAQGQKNKSKKVKSGESLPDKSSSSSTKSLEFFKEIESDKIRQLFEHYRYDFEIFDYSAEEYLGLSD